LFLKPLISFITILLLSSCTLQNDYTLPMPTGYQTHTMKNTTNQKITKTGFRSTAYTTNNNTQNKSVVSQKSGYIKGIIKDIKYSSKQKTWIYHIKATDLSNHKLKEAIAYGKKGLAHIGDLVYATINNRTITSLYVYKKMQNYKFKKMINKIKRQRKKQLNNNKTHKRQRRKEIISAPIPQKIVF